jgi:hypothetical protein
MVLSGSVPHEGLVDEKSACVIEKEVKLENVGKWDWGRGEGMWKKK